MTVLPDNATVSLSLNLTLPLTTRERIIRQRSFAAKHREAFCRLSRREREILTLIATGMSNEDIAKRIYVSVHTVRTHRNNIWRQLGIHNVVEAVWWAQCFDLV